MDYILNLIIRRYRWVYALVMLATLPFAWQALHPVFRNGVDIFFDADDPELLTYSRFQETFGNDEVVGLSFTTDQLFAENYIRLIERLTKELEELPGVSRVVSLTNVGLPRGVGDSLEFLPVIDSNRLDSAALQEARTRALSEERLQGIVSADGRSTALWIGLESLPPGEKKLAVINSIRSRANSVAAGEVGLHFSGEPVLEAEIDALVMADNMKFSPLLALVMALIVYGLLRSFMLTVIAMSHVGLVLLWGVGLLFMMGENLNTGTVIMGPVLLAVTFAAVIHFLTRFRSLCLTNGMETREAVRQCLQALWQPVMLTGLTTAAGYLSFVTTSVRPVRILGLYTSVGVLIGVVLTLTFLPAMLIMFVRPGRGQGQPDSAPLIDRRISLLLEGLGQWVTLHYRKVATGFILMALVGGWGMSRLSFNTDFMSYVFDDNRAKQDILFTEDHMGGTVPIELVVRTESAGNDFQQPGSLQLLDDIRERIMSSQSHRFTSSISIADYVKDAHRALHGGEPPTPLPGERQEVVDLLELADAEMIDPLLSLDRRSARVSLSSRFVPSSEHQSFERLLQEEIIPMLGSSYKLEVTGTTALYGHVTSSLRQGLISSFSVAFALILVMMVFVCGSLRLTLLSMVPNLFPIVMVLGFMGWFSIYLDTSTIMIASVTMGIAVDDTIHFVTWLRRNLQSGLGMTDAIRKAFSDTGKPILITTVVLSAGYLVLLSGSVRPIVAFGGLAAFAMVLALVGDLFILPALMLVFRGLPQRQAVGEVGQPTPRRLRHKNS